MNNKLINYQTKSTLSIISCTEKKEEEKNGIYSNPLIPELDPRIRIRIRIKMKQKHRIILIGRIYRTDSRSSTDEKIN